MKDFSGLKTFHPLIKPLCVCVCTCERGLSRW